MRFHSTNLHPMCTGAPKHIAERSTENSDDNQTLDDCVVFQVMQGPIGPRGEKGERGMLERKEGGVCQDLKDQRERAAKFLQVLLVLLAHLPGEFPSTSNTALFVEIPPLPLTVT